MNEDENIIKKSIDLYYKNIHEYVDYKKKICIKPWGYEFLCYESKQIGMWFLNINYENGTSCHTHLYKDTIIIVCEGLLEIEFLNEKTILSEFETIFIPKRKFHALKSLAYNTRLIEIEIYTKEITFTDKNDLIRYKDTLKRYDNIYSNSINIVEDLEKYNYFLFNDIKKYNITDNIKANIIQTIPKINDNNISILLSGKLMIDNMYISPGSIISKEFTSLDEYLILNLEFDNLLEYKKIIKNKYYLNYILNNQINSKKILTSGCFDIFHKGHMKILREAKKLGDILIVCLSSDEQIKYLKGDNRPINKLNDRVDVLKSINYIDYIICYEEQDFITEKTLDDYMNIIKPLFWVKGDDYKENEIRKLHPCLSNIKLINNEDNVSSSIIINKIINNLTFNK